MAKIVIALGGNALGDNPEEQKELVKIPAEKVASLVKMGHKVVVGHGNGPQVGMIFNAFADSRKVEGSKTPLMPFAEAGAMSQGYIGFHLATAIYNKFREHGMNDKEALYILTDTVVDANDQAFQNPTKPIGPFYATEEEAIAANPNSTVKEDAGRGYRKVVPSPKPLAILGIDSIQKNVELGATVVVGGGGGVPVVLENNQYVGKDAVIDKDFTLAKIANDINADTFIVLTAVDRVFVNYGKPDQKALEVVTVEEMEKYVEEGHFAPGSMLPKVLAAITFVKSGKNREAIIADLTKVEDALEGKSGTKIVLSK